MALGERGRSADKRSALHTPRSLLARVLGARADRRGQSLVEFALVLPVLLLITLIAVDFGRVYLGWINLQNMARIGANYAANNATSMQPGAPGYATAITQYANQITSDASATNCPLAPGQPAAPVFTGTSLGDRASVTLTCRFHVITPIISFIVGSDLNVTVSSVFPVKSAIVEGPVGGGGGGGGCLPPSAGINATPGTSGASPLDVTFRDASGGGAPTGWRWVFTVPAGEPAINDSPAQDPGLYTLTTPGTYTVVLTASNACGSTTSAPTTITVTPNNPPPACTVPNFTSNGGVAIDSAQGIWDAANFTTTVQVGNHPNNPANWKIKSQTIVSGTQVACDSTITVSNP
jgi:Flp pilus assembly protein TadG